MIICTVIYIVIFEVLLVIWILIRYNKNVCGAKTASGVIGDCQNRKQEDLFP